VLGLLIPLHRLSFMVSLSIKELELVVSMGRVTGFCFSVSGLGLVSILAFGSRQRE
jgi:hypothetical protein